MSEPTPRIRPTDSPTLPTDYQSKLEKLTYQGTRIQTHHRQTHHQTNLIHRRIAIPVNQLKRTQQEEKLSETQETECVRLVFDKF